MKKIIVTLALLCLIFVGCETVKDILDKGVSINVGGAGIEFSVDREVLEDKKVEVVPVPVPVIPIRPEVELPKSDV